MSSRKPTILAVHIISDATNAQKGFDQTASASDRMAKGMDRASVAAGAVLVGLGAMAMKLEAAGEAASTSNARITNITSSMGLMGDQAEVVSKRVIKSAEDMARKTGIDPNIIKQGQATLMTFENIAKSADQVGGVFDRAAKSSTDLAAAGFGSVESAATMLGKALNDPVAGMAAMTRVGVTFSDSQKDTIRALQESGDMLGAQQEILAAVERQVGGTAEATANASDKMKVSWQLAEEELGQKLLPAFEKLRGLAIGAAGWIADNADAVLILGAVIGALAGGILIANGAMKAWQAISVVLTAAQWALNIAMNANPVGLIITAIGLLIAIIALVILNWEKFAAIFVDTANAIEPVITGIGGWFNDVFTAIGAWWEGLLESLTAGIRNVIEWLQGALTWFTNAANAAGRFIGGSQINIHGAVSYAGLPEDRMLAVGYTGYTPPAPLPRLDKPGNGRGGASHTTNLTVNVTGAMMDPQGAAVAVKQAIEQAARQSGAQASAGARVFA